MDFSQWLIYTTRLHLILYIITVFLIECFWVIATSEGTFVVMHIMTIKNHHLRKYSNLNLIEAEHDIKPYLAVGTMLEEVQEAFVHELGGQ